MKAVAVIPGKAESIHLAELPKPSVHEVPNGRIREAAVSYRAAFKTMNCTIISESRSFSKGRIEYVFRAPRGATSEKLQKQLCELVPMDVRGEFDWEVE